MPANTTIKPEHPAIEAYYKTLKDAEQQQALHEGNVRKAFEHLIEETAKVKGWMLVSEQSEKRTLTPSPSPSGRGEKDRSAILSGRGEKAKGVRYDGVLRDQWRLPHGHWEAKDTYDDLDTEIRKKRERGYSFENILFEDTQTGVLFQDGMEVMRANLHDRKQVADLLTHFYSHEIAPFQKFSEAVAYFQHEIPGIAQGLKNRIDTAHQSNKSFQKAYDDFMELCKTALNPNISSAAVDEMLIQHMLTERIIHKVFKAEEFSRRNVIANEIENVINSLTSQHFNRTEFLGALDRFYTAIEDAADKLADFQDKQTFINLVYERFFQGYSVKIADTHGIVYTPQPIVDFMCAAVEEVLETEFGAKLGDESVWLIDPCTGTGNFIVNLLRRAYEHNPRDFDSFYRQRLFANEVMLMPYYIASLNIEHEYFHHTGRYEPFEGICFVDTLDLAEGAQMKLAFMTERNTERVERQKQAPITVIIGNPPYNAKQLNENDNNKNRVYEIIDKRVSETYAKDSIASNRISLFNPYVKFFRWATERLHGRNGVVCLVSDNSLLDAIAFDGMRKHLMQDFDLIYHFDFKGNANSSGERRRREGGNIFSDEIKVGIGITVLVRNSRENPSSVYYHAVGDYWTAKQKKDYLLSFTKLSDVPWVALTPDSRNTWLVPENADEFSIFIPFTSKGTRKSARANVEAIFQSHSIGVTSSRDSTVFNFNRSDLIKIVKGFIEGYNSEVDRWRRSGMKENIDDFVDYDKIKWSRDLKRDLHGLKYAEFDEHKVRTSLYRPFCKKHFFFDRILNQEISSLPYFFPTPSTEEENRIICVSGPGHEIFRCLIANRAVEYKYSNSSNGGTQCFPFYVYDEAGGSRRENITDWALGQFRAHYAPLPVFGEGPGVGSTPSEEQEVASTPPQSPQKGWAVTFSPKDLYEKIKPLARQMRNDPTPAENHLWQHIRHKQILGYKFRRQHAIDRFIVDFYCAEARLVIEVDGAIHDYTQEEDALRQGYLESLGLRVLRFSNGEVLQHIRAVVERIGEVLQGLEAESQPHPQPGSQEGEFRPHPQPLPKHREGSEIDSSLQHTEGSEQDSSPMLGGGREGVSMLGGGREGVSMLGGGREGVVAHQTSGQGVRVITKWDIFYYVYGLLHHPVYRERFADNLKRELPRIPFAPDFWAFSDAGKKLAELHLNYETVTPYKLDWVIKPDTRLSYRVEKMRLRNPHPTSPKHRGGEGHDEAKHRGGVNPSPLPVFGEGTGVGSNPDEGPGPGVGSNPDEGPGPGVGSTPTEETESHTYKTYSAIEINDTLTLRGIPAEAFEYRLGNRSALDWVIDQYQVSTDKRSGISSDPNGYSDDEKYIVTLVEQVVQVSVETVAIVKGLPSLELGE